MKNFAIRLFAGLNLFICVCVFPVAILAGAFGFAVMPLNAMLILLIGGYLGLASASVVSLFKPDFFKAIFVFYLFIYATVYFNRDYLSDKTHLLPGLTDLNTNPVTQSTPAPEPSSEVHETISCTVSINGKPTYCTERINADAFWVNDMALKCKANEGDSAGQNFKFHHGVKCTRASAQFECAAKHAPEYYISTVFYDSRHINFKATEKICGADKDNFDWKIY